jgi:putative spermidine/putrescine transport system ATP-binding protein
MPAARPFGRIGTANGVETASAQPVGAPGTSNADHYLILDRLTKRYGDKPVVRDVSLSVPQGEVLTILGPSGCGKTTTLKIIAGFLHPDSGSVRMAGEAVDRLSSHERGAAMVFQNYALFPHMTVQQNVAFGLRMRKTPKPEIAGRVEEMLERVRLKELADRYPKELSGGQQQRVALARALIIRPNVLLLDEPFSSLDAKLRKQLRNEFLEIHRAFHITSVFVTHDLEEAFAISDKVAVMNAGVMEQAGSPAEIFSRPGSRFVADFVGHRNIFTGNVTISTDTKSTFVAGSMKMTLPPHPAGPLLVSVPIHLLSVTRKQAQVDNSFPAVVEGVSYLGPIVQLNVQVEGHALESYATASPETESLRPGDQVHVGWNATDVVIILDGGT